MEKSKMHCFVEEQWASLQQGISEMKEIVENSEAPVFHPNEFMKLYTCVFDLSTCDAKYLSYSPQLYVKYCESIEEYISSVILPSLKNKQAQDFMLIRDFVQRWENYKVLGRWLFNIFHRLELYYIPLYDQPSLKEVALDTFRDRVYGEFNEKIRDAVMALIDKEREGVEIDRVLLKKVFGIFVEIKTGDLGVYEQDFEAHMIAYYSGKACSWIQENSCLDYVRKTEECLKKERDRISDYLPSSGEEKLIQRLQHELLLVHRNQLLEKLQFECVELLRVGNFDDLSELFRLVHEKIPQGWEAMADVFKQHIREQGKTLVQQAKEVAINHNVEEILVRKVVEMHDKYVAIVGRCFMNHELFISALKEEFEIMCNRVISGASTAQVLAAFSDKLKL